MEGILKEDGILNKLVTLAVDSGVKLLAAILILWIGLKLIKFLIKALRKGKLFSKMEKSLQSFLISFISVALKCILFISLASYLGIPMTSLITVLGSAAVAIGLALQGGLSNLAGGVMILLFKPFKIGDYVDTHADSGTVTDISLFYTTLQTVDNRVILLPNGSLVNNPIINYSKLEERRLDMTISVDYATDIDKVKEVITKTILEDERVLKDKDVFVRLTEMAESSLNFAVRVWVKTEDYWPVNFDLKENIKKSLDQNKISIPFPQMDVHVKN